MKFKLEECRDFYYLYADGKKIATMNGSFYDDDEVIINIQPNMLGTKDYKIKSVTTLSDHIVIICMVKRK